ncbi:restriction endonuclease subunit S [Clostridioides difficile]|uniref:restriction endonuclease subunit S n=1 Tax=Clostridioides difficile TaxID=1496 RepID=UPI0010AF8E5C|nr:restriction endonuclease subunit S [Clostridioides difficile]MBY1883511.1 restriction endonuclease subunit S [Clostridioides difficile]MBZ0781370.1 restriction endonuclease subunit S [Clostridioides difficile]MBZ0855014.1 restriction endonuclease subunit S [Clostridioides difficile]MCG7701636.1 restriction endonuclease subunit S [Clostridioides difficile]
MKYRYRNDEEMKDSGVKWIGQIPKDWEVKRNKYLLSEINIKNDTNDENLLSVSEYYGVALRKDKMAEDEYLTRAESLEGYKVCKKDDLVMNIMLAWKKAMGVSEYNGIVSPAYCIYRKKENISMKYYHYLFRTDLYANIFKQYSTGIIDSRLRLYPEKFLSLYSHNPNIEKQEKIANFLDEKTSQFDSIISKKEELIKKLEEAKKSLISEVVTGKVKVVKNDDGYELVKRSSDEMKDSGVEWLGEIPKDWEVKNFKHMFTLNKGLSITKADLKESGIPCVNYGEIHSKYRFELKPSKHKLKYVDESYLKSNSISLLNYGDFVFCDTSEDIEGCGNFTSLNENNKVFAGYHTIIARTLEQVNYRYMSYLFDSNDWRIQIRTKVSGVKVFSITQSILKGTKVILPDLLEQNDIAQYLDSRCNGINFAIDKTKLQIDKLKEAKQSLISEAVTGKIEILD